MSRRPDPVDDEPRFCPVCGARLVRGEREENANFKVRQTCGARACVRSVRRRHASEQAERQRHARGLREWPAWGDFSRQNRPAGDPAPLRALPPETLVERERWF